MIPRVNNTGASSPVSDTDKTDVQTALATLKTGGNATPSLAEIRATLPAGKRARFTEGMVHATAVELGLKVDVG